MAIEDEDLLIAGTPKDGSFHVGHLEDRPTPTVAAYVPGLGAMMCSPDAAREIARQFLVAADKAEGLVPSHIYMVDMRDS